MNEYELQLEEELYLADFMLCLLIMIMRGKSCL